MTVDLPTLDDDDEPKRPGPGMLAGQVVWIIFKVVIIGILLLVVLTVALFATCLAILSTQ